MSRRLETSKCHDLSDVPLRAETDWLDDFHAILDAIEPCQFTEVDSIAKLALIMSLNGFSPEDKELDDSTVWYGLVSWVFHHCSRYKELAELSSHAVEKDVKASKERYRLAYDLYVREVSLTRVIFDCIQEFASAAQEVRDHVLELLARARSSSHKAEAFADAFMKKLTEAVIPENDIPNI